MKSAHGEDLSFLLNVTKLLGRRAKKTKEIDNRLLKGLPCKRMKSNRHKK